MINLKKNIWGKIYWLENSKGEQITEKFIIIKKNICGPIILLKTDKGTFMYHRLNEKLFMSFDSAYPVQVYMLTENIYYVEVGAGKIIYLFNEKGEALNKKYDRFSCLSEGIISAKLNGHWGVVDKDLNWIISPCCTQPLEKNRYGYIQGRSKEIDGMIIFNNNGETVVEIKDCLNLEFLTEELILVRKRENYGVINIKGKEILPSYFYMIKYTGKYFIVQCGDKYGLYDIEGNIVFDCIYNKITETTEKIIAETKVFREISKI